MSVGVLRDPDARVAKDVNDDFERYSFVEHVGCRSVPEFVGMPISNTSFAADSLKELRCMVGIQVVTLKGCEHCFGIRPTDPRAQQVLFEPSAFL